MFVVMVVRKWDELGLQVGGDLIVGVQGMAMPMGKEEDGGQVPCTGFLPVFSTYEHAEAAASAYPHPVQIHEIAPVEEVEEDDLPCDGWDDIGPYDDSPYPPEDWS